MNLLLIATLILALLGIIMLFRHFAIKSPSYSNEQGYSWGLYISGFIFFATAGAGLLAVLVIVSLLRPESLPLYFKGALLLVAGMALAALLLLLANAGRPLVFLKNIFRFNHQSPLAWSGLATLVCLLTALVLLFSSTSERGALSLLLAAFSLVIAFFLIYMLSSLFIFTLGADNPYSLVSLVLKSLLEGVALLWYAGLLGGYRAGFDSFTVSLLIVLIVADLLLTAVSALLRRGNQNVYIIVASLAVLIIALLPFSSLPLSVVALVLILASGFYDRHNLVRAAQKVSYKFPEGMFYQRGVYRANLSEWLLFAGMLGLALFIGNLAIFLL